MSPRAWLLCILCLPPLWAAAAGTPDAQAEETPRWWEQREQRSDIYYPHKAHMETMQQDGDSCLRCHPFSGTDIRDPDQLARLNTIANEPLQAICHQCHVEQRSADWRCGLCHPDPSAIWPDDHNFDYTRHHAEDARQDENACRTCHLDLSFCSNCHFRRDSVRKRVHGLGYRNLHGIDARIDAASCGRCHNGRYCSDCHRETR